MEGEARAATTGLFVTGTDTGVGKTVVSAALLAAISATGRRVRAYKPVVTGLDEPHEAPSGGAFVAEAWPHDHELLASLSRLPPEEVSPLRYRPAVSPHLAAQLDGASIDASAVLSAARETAARASAEQAVLVVEGVGGLLVPLAENLSVRALAVALGLPLLIAARPSLGTINHTLLSIEAARTAGLEVRAVVLTPWPERPSTLELSNRQTIEQLAKVEVEVLAHVAAPSVQALAAAGAALPWRRWLEP